MATCIAATNAQISITSTPVSKNIEDHTKAFNTQMDPISKKMCWWAAPEYNRTGEEVDRSAWVAAQAVLAVSMIALNTHITNKQHEIAKAYVDIAEDKWKRFRDKYAPLERRMLDEASGRGEPVTDYQGAKDRAWNANNFAFNSANKCMENYAKQYALCLDPTQTLDRARALSRDDSVNFNYRDAENFNYHLSDKRWSRRSDILNIGRDNAASAFSYAQSSNQAFSGVASALQQAGSGLSGLLGYMFNRNETVYPATPTMGAQYGNGAIISGGI